MKRFDENKSFHSKPIDTSSSGFGLIDLVLLGVVVLCLYGLTDPSVAGDLVQAFGKVLPS